MAELAKNVVSSLTTTLSSHLLNKNYGGGAQEPVFYVLDCFLAGEFVFLIDYEEGQRRICPENGQEMKVVIRILGKACNGFLSDSPGFTISNYR